MTLSFVCDRMFHLVYIMWQFGCYAVNSINVEPADLIHSHRNQIHLDRNSLLQTSEPSLLELNFLLNGGWFDEILLYIWSDLWLLLLKLFIWISNRSFKYIFRGLIQSWWFQEFSWSPLLAFLSKLESIKWLIWWSLRREYQFGEMMVGHMLKVSSGWGLIKVLIALSFMTNFCYTILKIIVLHCWDFGAFSAFLR